MMQQQQQQQQQPATVVVPPAAVIVPVQGGCSCTVPGNASVHVRGARGTTIAIIVIHAIAFIAFGWSSWGMWLGALIAFIMGGVLLCQFNRCTYIVGGSLYVAGAVFDLLSMSQWISRSQAIDDVDYNGDYSQAVGWFALPAAIGVLSFIVGAAFCFVAICNWDKSGAPDAMAPPMFGGPQITSNAPDVQTVQYAPQVPSGKSEPPPYTNSV